MTPYAPESVLARITTHWSQIQNPVQFVARYAPAIQKYFRALIRQSEDAEDAAQDFLARISGRGFGNLSLDRARFRDYLTVAVKNSALNHLKRLRRNRTVQADAIEVEVDSDVLRQADSEWLANWQRCVLDQAWRGLFHYQRRHNGNLFHTVLKKRSDHAELTDAAVAELVAAETGQPLSPEAFRKQLSRARRMFAELIVEEIARTLESPTPERVEDELVATGLMTYVKPFLHEDWRQRGILGEAH
ncbi:MAG: hypothetical protein KDA62_01355 [Planctomycetales bacterium]|nr:hypothetical protein [Planctomycetales bacterium]